MDIERIKELDERFFVYQHPEEGLIFGKQEVRYQPNIDKMIFGTTKVTVYYPVYKELSNRFPLDCFPAYNAENPGENIIKDPKEGVRLLYIEANKAAKLLSCSILKLHQDKFVQNGFRILQISDSEYIDVNHPEVRDAKAYGVFMGVYGKVVKTGWEGYDKKECFIRKGDILRLTLCYRKVNEEPPHLTWCGSWYLSKQPSTIKSRIMKLWYKLTNKKLYRRRYVTDTVVDFRIPSDCIQVIGKNAESVG